MMRTLFHYSWLSMFALLLAVAGFQGFESEATLETHTAVSVPHETPRFLFADVQESVRVFSKGEAPPHAESADFTERANTFSVPRRAPREEIAFSARSALQTSRYVSGLYRDGNTPVPEIAAAGWLIGDLASGDVYASKDKETRWPLASLTKLMTAFVALREGDAATTVVTVPPGGTSGAGDGETTGLTPGTRYHAEDLVALMLVASSNDAAEAIAGRYGLGNFVSQMNAAARDMGLMSTYFADPTGLSVADQSTPDDMFRLVSNITATRPDMLGVTSKKTVAVSDIDTNRRRSFPSTNSFAGRSDFLGGKTGFTDEARGNLVSVFSAYGRQIVIIVFGTDDRFGETEQLFTWFKHDFTRGG